MRLRNFFFIAGLIYAANAQAFSVEHNFSVQVGAFDAARVKFTYRLDSKEYGIKSEVMTNGLFDTFYPFIAEYDTFGSLLNDKMTTQDYRYCSKSRFKKRSKKVIFDDKGMPKSQIVVTNGKEKTRDFAPSPTPADTFDLQTVMIKIAYQYNKLGFCATEMAVYDGKRRFDVEVVDMGDERLDKNEISPFSGKAAKCSMRIRKVLSEEDDTLWGFSANKPIDFWIMHDTKSGIPFIAQVRIKNTPLGELNAYNTEVKIEE